ncbi:MAG: hypothetical protein JSU07_03170 [Bacteroidetes bacterium]|nr:hypothetical protein [Bacteroidota bacterium]
MFSCQTPVESPKNITPIRVFEGYHKLMDNIIKTKTGVFRGHRMSELIDSVKAKEKIFPSESSPDRLYYDFKIDSITNFSIDYAFKNDSLEEINVQINSKDLELTNYLFCDLKDYYANKLPNPIEDKGYLVYNCYEGQRKPFVISLSDNSSPSAGKLNILIYKDK